MKTAVWITLLFVSFLCWIIYLKDSGQPFFLFDWAEQTPYGDKMGHFLLAGLFALLANLALRRKCWSAGPVRVPCGSFLVFLFLVIEEASQSFFPNRSCDITDLFADLAGIAFSSILLFVTASARP